jgi:FMN reductase
VFRPYIVGLGGTTREGSSTEKAVSLPLRTAASQGTDTLLLCGRDIDLPANVPGATSNAKANRITAELGRADGIILGTPGYHGGLSGLVKNALDYTEDLRSRKRPYLEDRPVGCVVTAAGEQGQPLPLLLSGLWFMLCGVGRRPRYNCHLRSGVRR